MKVFGRILALFLIVPFIELILMIKLSGVIGFWPTVGMIVATGLLGSYLAKREGLSVWRRFNERMRSGGMPSAELVDGLIILCSGALLIAPGVLTDLTGLLGMFPPTRALIRKTLLRRVEHSIRSRTLGVHYGGFGTPGGAHTASRDHAAATGWSGAGKESPGYAGRRNEDDGF